MMNDSLRAEIQKLAEERFSKKTFVPGTTSVPPSGKDFDAQEFVSMVDAVMDGWWTEGRFTQEFETAFAKRLGRHFCATTNSGSSANLLALTALTSYRLGDKRLKPGDEVITVAAGFPTTIVPILQNRCVPVFVDIDIANYNIDLSRLEEARSEKTRAVMIAHTLGNPFPAEEVRAFCDKYNLWLIEDTCDALGSMYRGKQTGTFGHISTFSFYPAHHITMGEGGALTTDDALLNKCIRAFRDWGRDCWCAPGTDNTCGIRFEWKLGDLPKGYDHKYIYSEPGYNLKVTDTQSALGLVQLSKLDAFCAARRKNHARLKEILKPLESVLLLPEPTKDSDPSWFGFLFTIKPEAPFTRQELANFLSSRKIGTRYLFAGNILRQPVYTNYHWEHRVVGSLANSDLVTERTLWVGCQPALTDEMIDYVGASIREFVEGYKKV